MLTPKLGDQLVTIWARWAARDAALTVTCVPGGGLPWPVVGHRPFDSEHTAVVIDDDQVEWAGRFVVCHGLLLPLVGSLVVLPGRKTICRMGSRM
jgi:hypothetical protein